MTQHDMIVKGLCCLIEIVSGGLWKATDNSTIEQANMYTGGIRDGRIADVTFMATTLARMINRE